MAALEFAITGKDEKQQPIADVEASAKVAGDICTVMLIKDHEVDSRAIFNKVNRYAKATTKAENLITADDDIVAVIVRSALVGMDNIIPEPLVNVKSNTLSAKSGEFTTLATLYESTKYVLENTHGRINTQRLPDKSVQGLMKNEATEFWETVCSSIALFDVALRDPSETGNEKRQQIRADYLLGKPFAQWALVQALVQLCNEDKETGARMSLSEACDRANQLTWRIDDRRWQQVLMNGDRVLFGKSAVNFASRVIAYWLGQPLNDAAVADLRSTYENQGGTRPLAEPIL